MTTGRDRPRLKKNPKADALLDGDWRAAPGGTRPSGHLMLTALQNGTTGLFYD
jgi:hypothetical protein